MERMIIDWAMACSNTSMSRTAVIALGNKQTLLHSAFAFSLLPERSRLLLLLLFGQRLFLDPEPSLALQLFGLTSAKQQQTNTLESMETCN